MGEGLPGQGFRDIEIRVDLDGLSEFAREVRVENDATLRRHAQEALGDFGQGVPFGRATLCGSLVAAQEQYRQAMVRAIDTMNGFIEEAEAMATFAEHLVAEYGEVDAWSASDLASVGGSQSTQPPTFGGGAAQGVHP